MSKYGYELQQGEKYGHLTTVKYVGVVKNRHSWECLCDCGNVVIKTESSIKSSKINVCNSRCRCLYDISGKRFSNLTVIDSVIKNNNGHKDRMWRCVCDCGKEVYAKKYELEKRHTTSCGCKRSERSRRVNTIHGHSKSKICIILRGMKQRCQNPKNKYYQNYGGRGISICEEWSNPIDGVINFYNWAINNGYKDGYSIERIDVNDNYSPENCKWIPMSEQYANRTDTRYVSYKNETLPLFKMCEKYNVKYTTVLRRLQLGWDVKYAIEIPVGLKIGLDKFLEKHPEYK